MEYQFEPFTFADRMIQLEAALEYEGSLALIWALNDLYRAGIDYYIQKQPKKAKFIQKKMTKLLANPDILRILEKERQNHSNNSSSMQKQKDQADLERANNHHRLNSSKLNEQVTKFHTVADSCIKNIVECSDRAANKTLKLKNLDLNKQQTKLEDRIALKRFKSQEKFKKIQSYRNLDQPFKNSKGNLQSLIENGKDKNNKIFS